MTTERLAIAGLTAWVLCDEIVYAAPLPDGPPFVLAGAGARIWCAVAEGGTITEVTARVADEVGSPAEALAADVTTFVDGLVAAGLLTRDVVTVPRVRSDE